MAPSLSPAGGNRRGRSTGPSRPVAVIAIALAVFILLDIGLFGWLLFRSMSQRQVEQILLDTRREAEALADRISRQAAGEEDLYTAIATEEDTQYYIESIPRERSIVRSVQIRDPEGGLVFESTQRVAFSQPLGESPGQGGLLAPGDLPLSGVEGDTEVRTETLEVPDIEVAIGELGSVRIGISPQGLRERIGVLRADLIRMTSWVAALTVLLLLTGYFMGWWLWRRSRQLQIAADEAEQMAYIGTLASGLAHEIRNPLNSLNLNMQMMKEEIDSGEARGPTAGRLLSITRSEISRLERLVTDFLSYARPRSPEREEIRPRDLFTRVRDVVGRSVSREGGRVEIEDRSGTHLHGDLAQLTQLLLNLVQNGVAAALEAGREPVIHLRASPVAGGVEIEVEDNGTGIPEEARERIFDVFYSTRKGGTGLGLAVVQRIVDNHRGKIDFESRSGAGTTFRVFLPESAVEEGGG